MKWENHNWADPELFIMADRSLIEKNEGGEFNVCQMQKLREPVMGHEQPWESDGLQQDPITGSILRNREDGLFHLWYHSHNRLIRETSTENASLVCRAISPDGIKWEKPALGIIPYDTNSKTNMIWMTDHHMRETNSFNILPNMTRGTFDTELIASAYSSYDDALYNQGITVLSSNDGNEWKSCFPPVLPLDGDAHCLSYDPVRKVYICTSRSYAYNHIIKHLKATGKAPGLKTKRHIAIAQSRDLVNWTPMVPVLEVDNDDPPNAEMYRMYIIPYGHAYAGLLQMFYIGRNMCFGPLDIQLSVSRDLLNWNRVSRLPILPLGKNGEWDSSHVTPTCNSPFPDGDNMRFWYGGKDTEHWQAGKCAMGTATLRKDGFACWDTTGGKAVLTTVVFHMPWATRLFLNYSAPHGEIKVEILNPETDEPLPDYTKEKCQPLIGDNIRGMVSFGPERGNFLRNNYPETHGKIKFRFHMNNAKLYAFHAANVKLDQDYKPTGNTWL